MKQTVRIAAIRNTRNENVKQLELRTDVPKDAVANPVAFFMEGHPAVSPSIEKRVAWQTVSVDFIKKHNLAEGDNFGEKIGFPDAKLVVKESTSPRTWTAADGSHGQRQAKINPVSGATLCQGSNPIYRDIFLSLDGKTIVFDPRNAPKNIGFNAEDEVMRHTHLLMADGSLVEVGSVQQIPASQNLAGRTPTLPNSPTPASAAEDLANAETAGAGTGNTQRGNQQRK